MKGGITRPSRLVDVNRLPGLDRIEHLPGGGVRIGALVRNADLAHDPDFARRFPAVAEALLSGASAQLRNAATVGGNLLQRTRCPYFYDVASACNKRDPGAGCEARGGDTRLHAVLGWSESCIATNPSDFCVPLVALDAVVEIEGTAGRREVPLESFHRLPGDAPERDSVLEPGELIVAVRLPAEAAAFSAHARYLKVRERTSYAFAVVSAAAALRIEGDAIVEARIALGGVAPEAVAGARGRGERWPAHVRTRAAFRRAAEVALADAQTVRRQCLQDRTRTTDRDAGSHAGRGRNARARAGTSGLSLCPRSRSSPPCLKSRSPRLRPICGTVRTSASRSPAATAILKVTGRARYAADNHPPGMLYAVLAVSSIARGRVTFLDVPAAKAHPGVVEVMTPANRPPLAQDPDEKTNPFMFRLDVLQNDHVRYANQPIAVVIAETLEAATEGAALLAPRYETEPARIGLDAVESFVPPGVGVGNPAEVHRGDVEAGLAAASSASRRPTRRRRNITTRWSRTRSSPHGTATGCPSTRRARASPWRRGVSLGCSESRRRTFISAAPSWAAGSAPRV